MTNIIGEMSGQVWQTLNSKGAMSVAKLKTALKADAFVLNAAIGWLAREEKVTVTKKGNTVTVSLK
ncbi:MAG: winged helix-turn-helix domain-containing protein [Calditrichae bacterium]|nr:winged helix-turn-helix domain-containing protein [Calditrichota bacterium]MCB9058102.1 winged helix-turn-helix domain-containing protein [Calditrichia bacterium]